MPETRTAPTLTHFALHVVDIAATEGFYQSYCGLKVVHRRSAGDDSVIWMAEPGRENRFVFVFIGGGPEKTQKKEDFSHLGIALASRAEVDAIADRARAEGILAWEPVDEPFPVGHYCGVYDPDGIVVEFSYGQPLGPGSEEAMEELMAETGD